MKKLIETKKDFLLIDILELIYLLPLTNLLDFNIIRHEQIRQNIDGMKLI